jgi:hypothetical protein
VKFVVGVNWGTFEGENARGFASALKLSDRIAFTGGVGVGVEQDVGGRGGVQLAW